MNVSLPEAMEEFVRQKVATGDYETASEVVREGLRLLKQRDEVWKADVRERIKQGMDSIRAGAYHSGGAGPNRDDCIQKEVEEES
jgi:antitoxin ParD1/3/4